MNAIERWGAERSPRGLLHAAGRDSLVVRAALMVLLLLIAVALIAGYMPFAGFAGSSNGSALSFTRPNAPLFTVAADALRVSLAAAAWGTALALAVGGGLGIVAAEGPEWMGTAILWAARIELAFPKLLLAYAAAAWLAPGAGRWGAVLAIVLWPRCACATCEALLDERAKNYVDAARSLQLGRVRILARHLLPNAAPGLVPVAFACVAWALSLEASLSYVGLALPVSVRTLGGLLASGDGARSLLAGAVLGALVLACWVVSDATSDSAARVARP